MMIDNDRKLNAEVENRIANLVATIEEQNGEPMSAAERLDNYDDYRNQVIEEYMDEEVEVGQPSQRTDVIHVVVDRSTVAYGCVIQPELHSAHLHIATVDSEVMGTQLLKIVEDILIAAHFHPVIILLKYVLAKSVITNREIALLDIVVGKDLFVEHQS